MAQTREEPNLKNNNEEWKGIPDGTRIDPKPLFMAGRPESFGQTPELPLHRVDAGDVSGDVVVAAVLVAPQLKPAAGEGCSRTGAAEMGDHGEILFLLQSRAAV